MPSQPSDAGRPTDPGLPLADRADRADHADRAEAGLLARAAAAELPAFEQLYRLYHPRLARFLDRMTRRPELIGEVINDTMMVVWKRAASFDGSSKVSTWIFAIAYRKALKALSRLDEPVEDPDEDDRTAPSESEPEQHAARAQVHARLAEAMDRLSLEQRAVMQLCYFHGIGCREVGEIVGCPVDTVKTRLFHARRRLRQLLPGRLEDWL